MVFPYLNWCAFKCCYCLPFCAPYDPNAESAAVDDENGQLLPSSSSCVKQTYTCNGKEYTKRQKKKKKTQVNADAVKEEPLAQLGFGIVAYI